MVFVSPFQWYVLFISLFLHGYGGEYHVMSEEEDLDLERQLKIVNKPAIKTFQVLSLVQIGLHVHAGGMAPQNF